MTLAAIIEGLRSTIEDPSLPELSRWKLEHKGGKAIGNFPVYAPVEMIDAAGMLPVHVAGAAGRIRLDEADGCLQAFVCSVGRSTLELKLDGFLDELDGMIFPSTCEISRGLSGVMARHDAVGHFFFINFPQNLSSAGAKEYLTGELQRLKKWLEEIGGSAIGDDAFHAAFERYNRRSELLDQLDRYRVDHPERLTASDFYILRLAGMTSSVEKHIELLEKALSLLDETEERHQPKLRMVLTGAFCERPPLAMLETIENEGIAIVSDDLLLSQRWWTKPLPTEGNPIEILSEHYLKYSVQTSVVFRPWGEPCDVILKTIEDTRANGIIIASSKFCHNAMHDSTCLVKVCEAHGLPYIRLEYEEDQSVFESIRVQVEALLEARERLAIAGTEEGRETEREE